MSGFLDLDSSKASTAAAAVNPKPGMGFHEMYSYWVFVVAVSEHVVQVVIGYGHPSWFPECGKVVNVPRDEFPDYVKYEYLNEDHRYNVTGWGARAEGLTVEQLEQRVRTTDRRSV